MGHMWNPMSLKNRVLHYRQLAAEVFGLAESSQDAVARADFFSLARGWHDLALELEHSQGLTGEKPSETTDKTSDPDAQAESKGPSDA